MESLPFGNKLKQSETYGRYLMDKKNKKRKERLQRLHQVEALGEQVMPKKVPRTLDNTREYELTTVAADDTEVLKEQSIDEFADYFNDKVRPKILCTTRPNPSGKLFHFVQDLMDLIPQLYYYPRKSYSIKYIVETSLKSNKKFTHIMVLSEKAKLCNGMMICHIRDTDASNYSTSSSIAGPTAFFKVTNVVLSKNIPNNGRPTSHVPELVLNGFTTRLGQRIGRLLGSLLPHNSNFVGRQAVTFHNHRDWIFVRRHRYIFEEVKTTLKKDSKSNYDNKTITKTRLQELGPRFTLKLRWIMRGTFDTKFGEYEWLHKRKVMDTSRKKFHL